MGIAAYNRGSKLIGQQADDALPDSDKRFLSDITAYSAGHDGDVLFAPTVVRFGPRDGEFSLMNRQDGGWASSCRSYGTIWTVARKYRLAFLGLGADAHSRFYIVHPLPKE